tara:strand:- start:478 stop:603 length:126 start_codon:yes stop_codon:yes gene_type:complete
MGMEKRLQQYKYAYDIFMDYWDLLPEEAMEEVKERLKEVGL